MVSCPTCGKDKFSSDRSMRHHHSIVHNIKLPNVICEDCGEEFVTDSPSKRKYCDDCDSFSGEKNGNWSGGKSTSLCIECGEILEYYESEKPGFFCKDCVRKGEYIVTPTPRFGKENPNYNSIEVSCVNCENDIVRQKSLLEKYDKWFCSTGCYGDWRSDNQVGKKNPNYSHGKSPQDEFYRGKWSKNRKTALERDQYTCQECGIGRDELGHNPDVHHIDRGLDDVHSLDNLVSLCTSCHLSHEHGDKELSCL